MDAIVTAGGIPLPEEPLYDATMGNPKALVDVAGKPMVQWVLDALSASSNIDNVIVVGLTDKSGLKCEKKMYFVSNQGKMVENLQAGAQKVLEINNKAEYRTDRLLRHPCHYRRDGGLGGEDCPRAESGYCVQRHPARGYGKTISRFETDLDEIE